MNVQEQLAIISKAWGKQDGYCFFPWIPGDAEDKRARIRGYHEGQAYHWPADRARILRHLEAHVDDDVYWCPNLFEQPRRQAEVAMDEHALWADLDEVDPRKIDQHLRPTIAWETSPGRFQGLWLIQNGFLQNASWPGFENQKLTYYLGADNSGWDTTQLLRIPGWRNHKPERREENGGEAWQGVLLWKTGPRYLPDHFTDLPDVEQTIHMVDTLVDAELGNIDRHEVWARVRLKIAPHIREQFRATDVPEGQRSEVLWQMARELADAGCTATEIVALIRPTGWNKYKGRGDELKRLTIEASKALAEVDKKITSGDGLEVYQDHVERPDSIPRIADFLRDIKPPDWLIQHIWAKGSCGFIAGQPKSYKSWTGLDFALSVATGNDFLGSFKVMDPGPVLYIQEEDSGPMLKKRFGTMMRSRGHMETATLDDKTGTITLSPKADFDRDPYVHIMLGHTFIISDEGWQAWLDETLDRQAKADTAYKVLMLDPLMMIQGDVEENRAAQMTEKVFKPLKVLARKYGVAVVLIHHMRKGDGNGQRGGQMMLGSVANHAWTEDSLYLSKLKHGEVGVEVESKHAQGGMFKIRKLRNREWTPEIYASNLGDDDEDKNEEGGVEVLTARQQRRAARQKPINTETRARLLGVVQALGGREVVTADIARALEISPTSARNQLVRAERGKQVRRAGQGWSLV